MWITTRLGVFSIVFKPADLAADSLTVRARARNHLEALRDRYIPDLRIVESAGRDHGFRSRVHRQQLATAIADTMLDAAHPHGVGTAIAEPAPVRLHRRGKIWPLAGVSRRNAATGTA